MQNPQTSDSIANDENLISVVIPAYNAAAYISGTLRSVFAQTYRNFEVIVVNDGSPDTSELERELLPYFSRIEYLSQENRGPSAARNVGILRARGRFVAFLDSDDLWFPQHLSRQMETLKQNSSLGLIYANALHLKENRPVALAFDTVPQSGEPTFDSLLAERCTINTSSVVVRREALSQVGLFDEAMNRCEDFDLWLRLASAGVRMAYDREVHVGHRLGKGLAANNIEMKRGRLRAYDKIAGIDSLTTAQSAIIQQKLRTLDSEIATETAKQALLAGKYEEALSAARKAGSLGSIKIRFAFFGLRLFPDAIRFLYKLYLSVLQFFKESRRTRKSAQMNDLGLSKHLDALIDPGMQRSSPVTSEEILQQN